MSALYEQQRATADFLHARGVWIFRWLYRLFAGWIVVVGALAIALFLVFGEGGASWGWLVPLAQAAGGLLVVVILPINAAPPAFRERTWFDKGLIASQVAIVVAMLSFAASGVLELAWGWTEVSVSLTLAAMVLVVLSLAAVSVAWTRRPF